MLNVFSDEMQVHLAVSVAKVFYMQETFKERMKRLRLRAELNSQQEAADAIGCERGTVGMWEAPSSSVDSVGGEYLMGVAKAYKVRPDFINIGKGDDGFPWKPGDAEPDPDWPDIIGVKQAAALGDGVVPDEYAETHKLKFRADSLRRKRLQPGNLAVIYGKGDSMHPTITDGDAIMFDKSDKDPRDDQLYVITYDGDLIAKRLMELDGTWYASNDNEDDPKWRKPKRLDPEKGLEIAGRIRWVARWVD